MREPKELFAETTIYRRVRELAWAVASHYTDKPEPLLLLGVLKGSVVFLADLLREFHRPVTVEFAGASSYGDLTQSSGEVKLWWMPPEEKIRGRHVVIVEDIVDTGLTMQKMIQCARERGAASVEVCTLLSKSPPMDIRWVGFEVDPNTFVVGYGMDYAEGLRHLPYIGVLEPAVHPA